MPSDSLRSELEQIRDRHTNAAREVTELLALKWPEVYGRVGPIQPAKVAKKPGVRPERLSAEARTLPLPLPPKPPAKSKKSSGAKRSPLTVARQRIGQAKRRGKEPSAEDVAFVAAAEVQVAE